MTRFKLPRRQLSEAEQQARENAAQAEAIRRFLAALNGPAAKGNEEGPCPPQD
jgi:hypothetical protein